MKTLHCEQGSLEWKQARLGIPTASEAKRLIKKDMRKKNPVWERSEADSGYLAQCLAEWILQAPLDEGLSQWMDRGTESEPDARNWYEFENGVDVECVGFCTNDAGTFGASPDGLVGNDGGLEIKTPSAVNHVAYMLNPESLYDKYKVQVQASLFVTGRKWWDLMSWNPSIKPVVYRVMPDPEFAEAFAPILNTFLIALEAHKNDYRKYDPDAGKPRPEPEPDGYQTVEELMDAMDGPF
jgi:hypothetical protein